MAPKNDRFLRFDVRVTAARVQGETVALVCARKKKGCAVGSGTSYKAALSSAMTNFAQKNFIPKKRAEGIEAQMEDALANQFVKTLSPEDRAEVAQRIAASKKRAEPDMLERLTQQNAPAKTNWDNDPRIQSVKKNRDTFATKVQADNARAKNAKKNGAPDY